jgi:predicted MFS family arabinose efflux permease
MWAYMLWGVGEGLWLFIQPLYLESLGASPSQSGFILGLLGSARVFFVLPVGLLADRLPARKLLIPGWFLGVLGTLLLALAPSWQWTAPGYFIYGLSSVSIPITNVYLAQAIQHDPSRRPDLPLRASFSLLWAAYSIGLVVSPSIGGWIGDQSGLRLVFWISLGWFSLSTWAIYQTHDYPKPERPPQGYDYRGLLTNGAVLMPFGIMLFAFVMVYIGNTLSPRFLDEQRGFATQWIGFFGSVGALGTSILSLTLSRLSSWRGFFASLLLVLLAFVLLFVSGLWIVVALAYFGFGAFNVARSMIVSILSERVAEHQRGTAYAMADTLAGLAAVLGSNLAGRLYATKPELPYLTAITGIGTVLFISLILLRMPHKRQNRVRGVADESFSAVDS